MDGGKPRRPQAYTKNDRHLRNVDGRRSSLLQGRTHQLVIQYAVVSRESTSDVTQTGKVIFINMCICMYVCNTYMDITIKNEAMNLKENKEYMGLSGWRKRKGKMMQL